MNGFETGLGARFKIATLARIPIYVTTWFIFLLAFVALQAIVDRDWSSLIWVTVVMVVIVLHELGHAFAARHFGNQIHGITLHLFGGLMEHTGLVTRKERILISLAGPAVNLILLVPAAVFYYGNIDVGATGSYWIAAFYVINLILMVFNLIPIYPLDGGNVARSLLEKFFGSVRAMVYGSIMSLFLLAAVMIYAAFSRWGVITFLLLGTLAVTNVMELRRGLQANQYQTIARRPLGSRIKSWLARVFKRKKIRNKDIRKLLSQALQNGLASLNPDERRALIWHKAKMDLRIQQLGYDSVSKEEQELFLLHHELMQGKVVH